MPGTAVTDDRVFDGKPAIDPNTVAETIRMAAEVGLSGCGIEDMAFEGGLRAYDFDLTVERIRAAVSAARALGRPFVLTARADGVMNGLYDVDEGIRRLQAFEAAHPDAVGRGLNGAARLIDMAELVDFATNHLTGPA